MKLLSNLPAVSIIGMTLLLSGCATNQHITNRQQSSFPAGNSTSANPSGNTTDNNTAANKGPVSTPSKQGSASLNSPSKPVSTSLNSRTIPKHGDLATSIPNKAEYLEVEFADKSNKKVQVLIGHQLTTQGAGIQDHGPVFYPSGNRVTVYIPLGVVFEVLVNGDVFAYFPAENAAPPKHPKSVWLLMYGGTESNYVMTGGRLSIKDLAQWGVLGQSPEPGTAQYLKEAEQDGWHISQTVNMKHNLTGYLGHNGWAQIPIGIPVNLVYGGANDILEVRGVVSQKKLLKTHPELKQGIETASVSPY